MIKNLLQGDLVVLKSTNNPGFVCNMGKFAYFLKMNGIQYECTLIQNPNSKKIVLIQEHQINSVIDSVTNIIKYRHDPSDGL